jgi:hypothetical protein
MTTDFTASFSRITNEVEDFYDGMREYWSTRTLMQGYGEAAKDITELVEDATRHSNPLVQACAGSGLAIAKMLGAIPIGIDHWVIETARSTVHKGYAAGFKTLIGTPIEGFVDGGKFVINQVKNWSQGNISSSTMGVADEVATTLGTAGLMFLGIKGVQSGGTGLVNGIKNIEIHTPSLTYVTGQVMPGASVSAGAISGGPLGTGLVYMSSTNNPSDGSPSNSGQGGIDIKRVTDQAATDPNALGALKYLAKNGNPEALGGLVELARKDPEKFTKELKQLAEDGLESSAERLDQLAWDEKHVIAWKYLLDLGRRKNPGAVRMFKRKDLQRVLNQDPINRANILEIRAGAGDAEALQALLQLAQNGDEAALSIVSPRNQRNQSAVKLIASVPFDKPTPIEKICNTVVEAPRIVEELPLLAVDAVDALIDWLSDY